MEPGLDTSFLGFAPLFRLNGFDAPLFRLNGFDAPLLRLNGFDAPLLRLNGLDPALFRSPGFDPASFFFDPPLFFSAFHFSCHFITSFKCSSMVLGAVSSFSSFSSVRRAISSAFFSSSSFILSLIPSASVPSALALSNKLASFSARLAAPLVVGAVDGAAVGGGFVGGTGVGGARVGGTGVGEAGVGGTAVSSLAFVAISDTTGAEVGFADGLGVTGAALGLGVGLEDTGETLGLDVESSKTMHRPPKPGKMRHLLSLEQQGTTAAPSSPSSHMSPLATQSDCPVVGLAVGSVVGFDVGDDVGAEVGPDVGPDVGALVGLEVGSGVALLARPVSKPATVAG